MVPFRIEDVPMSKNMEYFLSSPHWLDAMTPPLERHLRTLAQTVKRLVREVEELKSRISEGDFAPRRKDAKDAK